MAILIIVILISIFISMDIFDDKKISLILQVINATQIFVTIAIAVILYDRFGTSKKILDK